MRIIKQSALKDFWQQHSDAEQSLKAWYTEAKAADWKEPSDIKSHYRTVSILKDSRVVFNISGNKYRLVVKNNYRLYVLCSINCTNFLAVYGLVEDT